MSSHLSAETWWRLSLAAAAGFWIGRKIPPAVAVIASGVTLALLPRRASAPPLQQPPPLPIEPDDNTLWPKAPVAEPFVPHTRAWDDLREALSPVLHAPAPEPEPAPKGPAKLAEVTHPFIDDEAEPAADDRPRQ